MTLQLDPKDITVLFGAMNSLEKLADIANCYPSYAKSVLPERIKQFLPCPGEKSDMAKWGDWEVGIHMLSHEVLGTKLVYSDADVWRDVHTCGSLSEALDLIHADCLTGEVTEFILDNTSVYRPIKAIDYFRTLSEVVEELQLRMATKLQ